MSYIRISTNLIFLKNTFLFEENSNVLWAGGFFETIKKIGNTIMGNNDAQLTMMMLGTSGVGKTTLLSTMYKELSRMNAQEGFGFQAEDDTAIDLQEAFLKLNNIMQASNFSTVERLLDGTSGIAERKFSVLFEGKNEFDFSFYDYAGGLVGLKNSESEDAKQVKALLKKSRVIINVIDGASLMEGSQFFNEYVNNPFLIAELLKKIITDEQVKRKLILFVITKCETWLKDTQNKKGLKKAFEDRHKEVLNVILSNPQKNTYAVLIPVKTLGCVGFSRINNYDTKDEEMIFVKKSGGVLFKPEYLDQPLRYALAFALSETHKNKGFFTQLMNEITGKNKRFHDALKQFANNRNKEFESYGNESLLP